MSLAEKLATERRGRLAAERLLELKQAELYAANRKLGLHARALSEEIVETRAQVESVTSEYQRVKSDLSVAHQKVEIAERRLWHSLQTIQDGFAFFDTDDCLIAANQAYLVVFEDLEEVKPGIPYARMLQLLTEEGIVDTQDKTAAEWRSDMLRRRQRAEPDPIVVRLWNDQYIKLVDHRGAGGDLISLGLNITATVNYEHELKESRAKAEAAARAKSAFLANMSHEIRTPMNGVVGMAELLCDTGLSEEQQLYVDTIRNSGEALLVIINDVLDYSKIEAQKMVLKEAPLDLEKSIHEVLMLIQPAAQEKNVTLILDYDMFLPHLFIGDVGRIRQILTNLIGNAVKFTPEGHVLVRATGAPTADNGATKVQISIEDTGIGIEPEQLSNVFGEFTQVDDQKNRMFEGTGLGLTISKRLVEMMGGEIWASSEPDIGSCFGFGIPLTPAQDSAAPNTTLPATMRKALVVDENPTNRKILQKQLEHLSILVEETGSVDDALVHLATKPDLVLIAHQLPGGIDGVRFLKNMRAQGHETPAILLTSSPGSIKDPEVRAQVSAVLARPLPRDRLIGALRDLGARLPLPAEAEVSALKTNPASGAAKKAVLPVFRRRSAPTSETPSAQMATRPVSTPVTNIVDVVVPASEPPAAPSLRKMRILAAEDNKTNQLVFRKMIKLLDIDLQIANDGSEAVKAYQSFKPDIIFMDISMPVMDGKEATRAIRGIESDSEIHVPIVAMTAHAMDGDDLGILSAGLDHYMTKPLRKQAIHEMILQYAPQDAQDPFHMDEAQSA